MDCCDGEGSLKNPNHHPSCLTRTTSDFPLLGTEMAVCSVQRELLYYTDRPMISLSVEQSAVTASQHEWKLTSFFRRPEQRTFRLA